MKIKAEQVKKLREITGVSISKCKESLESCGGDLKKAILDLRKKGETSVAKKEKKQTGEGIIASYIHSNNAVGALVKICCETDFVARNEDFKQLGKDIAMQVTATSPKYLSAQSVPAEVLEKERKIEEQALEGTSKPKEIVAKIIENKLNKFKEENSLLSQSFIKNPEITVEELIKEKINKLGENIKIIEFSRLEIHKK